MSLHPDFRLFSGTSHKALAESIGKELGVQLGKLKIETFPDGEIGVQILENVRGRDVFVVQSIARHPNLYLMELLILLDAFKRASARNIVVVLSYYGYGRQDRKGHDRVPVTAKLVANLLEKAGATQVLTMDVHAEQVQGFFDIPVDNLSARPLFVEKAKAQGIRDCAVVAPDLGSVRLARLVADDFGSGLAIVDKRRVNAKEVQPGALIGSVKDKDVILVDDILSTGTTLRGASHVCKQAGARRIIAAVTHALSTKDVLKDSAIDELWITDTIASSALSENVQCVSTASHFAKAIRYILEGHSLSPLFEA